MHLRPSRDQRAAQPLRFDLRELSGSLGDMGTFLPLAVAMALSCAMDIGLIFIFAGLMNIATGYWFRQPIPVQPMKAIAAVAIAEGLSPGMIASAGMATGLAVVLLAGIGAVDWSARIIPKTVVRGIQVGIGLKLAWTGIQWLAQLPAGGTDSWAVAIMLGLIVIRGLRTTQPVLLYIFLAGFILLGINHPQAYRNITLSWPDLAVVMPTAEQWHAGVLRGAIPQLPLTLLNSVIAICALSEDYFPGRGIPPRQMAASVGMMNLLCVPFGAMPMCHGAGGLAAQYRFGARTGGSVILLGVAKVLAGVLLGTVLLNTLQLYPVSILALMVVVAGITLACVAKDSLHGRPLLIIAAMSMIIITVNTLVGFAIGCMLAGVFVLYDRSQSRLP